LVRFNVFDDFFEYIELPLKVIKNNNYDIISLIKNNKEILYRNNRFINDEIRNNLEMIIDKYSNFLVIMLNNDKQSTVINFDIKLLKMIKNNDLEL
jgi:hypothetical protein